MHLEPVTESPAEQACREFMRLQQAAKEAPWYVYTSNLADFARNTALPQLCLDEMAKLRQQLAACRADDEAIEEALESAGVPHAANTLHRIEGLLSDNESLRQERERLRTNLQFTDESNETICKQNDQLKRQLAEARNVEDGGLNQLLADIKMLRRDMDAANQRAEALQQQLSTIKAIVERHAGAIERTAQVEKNAADHDCNWLSRVYNWPTSIHGKPKQDWDTDKRRLSTAMGEIEATLAAAGTKSEALPAASQQSREGGGT